MQSLPTICNETRLIFPNNPSRTVSLQHCPPQRLPIQGRGDSAVFQMPLREPAEGTKQAILIQESDEINFFSQRVVKAKLGTMNLRDDTFHVQNLRVQLIQVNESAEQR